MVSLPNAKKDYGVMAWPQKRPKSHMPDLMVMVGFFDVLSFACSTRLLSLVLARTGDEEMITDSKVDGANVGPTWAGCCRPQMGPMLAAWTLLSGILRYGIPVYKSSLTNYCYQHTVDNEYVHLSELIIW